MSSRIPLMVAFVPSISLWAIALLSVYQLLKPRLPKYAFRIQKIRPDWFSNQLQARVGAGISLRNDNFVPIDIYALSCDIFYPDWDGDLNHVGHVHDAHQGKPLSTSKSKTPSPPLWVIEPRQTFETNDQVVLVPTFLVWGVFTSLFYDLIRKYGTINIPSSMVIHLKANKNMPMTMGILCDNELNAWTFEMMGITCEMDSISVGWVDMQSQVFKLRTSVIEGHQPLPFDDELRTSIVGKKSVPPIFHDELEKAKARIDWRDVPMFAT